MIVKEVGNGISVEVAMRLHSAGVAAIDVAGKGGTVWSAVEAQRASQQGKPYSTTFTDWGIPTEEALVACRAALPDIQLVASGGIRSGLDVAKSIALGADLAAFGQPLLAAALESADKVVEFIAGIIHELKVAMLCAGAANLAVVAPSSTLVALRLTSALRLRIVTVRRRFCVDSRMQSMADELKAADPRLS